jgi:hypothetical protein
MTKLNEFRNEGHTLRMEMLAKLANAVQEYRRGRSVIEALCASDLPTTGAFQNAIITVTHKEHSNIYSALWCAESCWLEYEKPENKMAA